MSKPELTREDYDNLIYKLGHPWKANSGTPGDSWRPRP
jgi:hypothetical protein